MIVEGDHTGTMREEMARRRTTVGSVGAVQIAILVIITLVAVSFYLRVCAKRSLTQKIRNAIEQKKSALVRRRAQLVREDAYGKLQLERWIKEIEYFITNYIEPLLSTYELKIMNIDHQRIVAQIEKSVVHWSLEEPAFHAFSQTKTPAEFEVFCADQLRRGGWKARVIGQRGDQGADVMAEKHGLVVVVQCKRYAKPVSNKAIQEAAAARAHHKAHYSIVVTNSTYTPAAEQLAKTNSVLLLHYSDLQRLDHLVISDLAK
jgi:restriction endonuclease